MQRLIFALVLTAACTAAAQSRLFTDSRTGVSFRYPATWTIASEQPFMNPILSELGTMPHALVYTKAIPGVSPWPITEFAGAAFAYDAEPAASPEACHALALPADKRAAAKDDVTIHGIRFWHAIAGDGGMSKFLSEDIYSADLGAPTKLCLLFDFGVDSVLAPADVPLRALTPREKARLHRVELNILSSIRVPLPSR